MTVDPNDPGQTFVSVVIPTHNRAVLLERVLAALNAQSYPIDRFEVIVVVDGSTDGTRAMLDRFPALYPLRLVDEPQSGPAVARNRGILASGGDVILFLDDDVVPRRDLVAAHASLHERDRFAVVIGRVLPAPGDRPGWEYWEDAIAERDYRRFAAGVTVDGGHFYTWNVSVCRRCLDDVGGFDTSLAFQEDVDLGYRLQAASAHFYFSSEAAGYHCGHRPTYAIWCRRHYRFGWYRLEMQRRGGTAAPKSLRESYAEYHPFTRWMLRATIGRRRTALVVSSAIRSVADGCNRVNLRPIANYAFSALAVFHYWRGVADGFGDPTTLRSELFANQNASNITASAPR